MAVAEAWVPDGPSMSAYVRPDELDQAFNFSWLLADWSAPAFAEVIRGTIAATGSVGASPTWVLSNHDVVRHPTRYGGGERGLARARAATLTMLALPGAAYLYQGEELGLEEIDVAPEHRQDPAWFRTREPGRDGCRVPLPWSGAEPPFGFGPGEGQPWIPQPDSWKTLTVDAQQDDPNSTLSFYRAALDHRRRHATPAGEVVELVDGDEDVLAFRRGPLTVVLNCGEKPVELPAGEVLLGSGPLDQWPAAPGHRRLAGLTIRWLRCEGRLTARASKPPHLRRSATTVLTALPSTAGVSRLVVEPVGTSTTGDVSRGCGCSGRGRPRKHRGPRPTSRRGARRAGGDAAA